jgi:hypothetical protein
VTLRMMRRDVLLRSCGLSLGVVTRVLRETRRLGVREGRKPVTVLRAESHMRRLVEHELPPELRKELHDARGGTIPPELRKELHDVRGKAVPT